MDKSYNFYLHNGNHISFNIPTYRGELVTNRFMPDFLSPSADSPFAAPGGIALIASSEFEQDCKTMVDYINENHLKTNLDTSYMDALMYTLVCHIKRCGRLFFSDLCTYIDETTYLMFGFGYDENLLRDRTYPQMAYISISNLKDYVKVGSSFGVIHFTNTSKWFKLKEYCESKHL